MPTAVIFLDLNKAFNTIWLDGLLYRLIMLNIRDSLIFPLHSYLFGRSFRVQVKRSLSSLHSTGVPQGSVLGPILFNLYINDIPRSNTLLALYADDTAVISSAHHPITLHRILQQHISTIEDWSRIGDLSLI